MELDEIGRSMREKLDQYETKLNQVYSANARRNDSYLESIAYFLTMEDLHE